MNTVLNNTLYNNYSALDDSHLINAFQQINTDSAESSIPISQNEPRQPKKAGRPHKLKGQEKKRISKRSQVKNACVNCQKACKKCDDGRACQRCIKFGMADTCVDSPRKERKKGFKRGPYRKREKQSQEANGGCLPLETSSLLTTHLGSSHVNLRMQPADQIAGGWKGEEKDRLRKEEKSDLIVPGYYPEPSYSIGNTRSSTSSPIDPSNSIASAVHINPNDLLPLYDNALFALPKTENNIFISVTPNYDLNSIHDAFRYQNLDLTHPPDQWLKNTLLDHQDFITGIYK
ncbi:hypothetical protein BY458DRAFT_489116 [Sporodiniella umbellata]|nr:hypothetical protein BY458DRAFT_489116 [Sporodiniella umbellata]